MYGKATCRLEYANSVWNPFRKGNIDDIEKNSKKGY